MAAPMVRTKHQAVRDLRQRLDDVLRLAGLGDAARAVVTVSAVEGMTVNRIRIAALSIQQTVCLTEKLGGQITGIDAREVAKALDAVLHGIGIIASPSIVMWNTWTATRIIPPSMSLGETEQLVKAVEERLVKAIEEAQR